jgi:hypothetical protein
MLRPFSNREKVAVVATAANHRHTDARSTKQDG